MTPSIMTPGGVTPVGALAMGLKTPAMPVMPMTPDQMAVFKWEREIDERNRSIGYHINSSRISVLLKRRGIFYF